MEVGKDTSEVHGLITKTVLGRLWSVSMKKWKISILMFGCLILVLRCYGMNKTDAELFEQVKSCLVLIYSGEGTGSGFLCEMDGRKWIVTNEHVTRGGSPFLARFLDGEEVRFNKPTKKLRKELNKLEEAEQELEKIIGVPLDSIEDSGDFEVAANRDLVRIRVDIPRDGLQMAIGMPKMNDAVYVFGNSDGSGAITCLSGKILGIGADRIEVDVPFIQGNSGSAILNKEGEVMGVATYAIYRNEPGDFLKRGTRFNDKVRRFGVRLMDIMWQRSFWYKYSDRAEAWNDLRLCSKILTLMCFNERATMTRTKVSEMARFRFWNKLRHPINRILEADSVSPSRSNKVRLAVLCEVRDIALKSDWHFSRIKEDADWLGREYLSFLVQRFKELHAECH